ncbi:uncharacterized protein LOC121826623 isoform X2 [Peromyscus maniculatus bairdii]|uniref:uncharacterized protein LOC121826623 isoform X2 n=1 Tax=Peromyscus maniculatus bairdii TaxID=230844 RepID=UPI003FD08F0A
MQEDTDPDALSIQAPKRARWYTCLWPSCLGHGCCCRKRRSKFPLVNGQDTRSRLSEKPDGPASTPGKEDTTYVVTKSKKQLFYFTNICTLKKMKTEINLSSLEKKSEEHIGSAIRSSSVKTILGDLELSPLDEKSEEHIGSAIRSSSVKTILGDLVLSPLD